MKIQSENRCFEGTQGVYQHWSESCKCEMVFGLFVAQQRIWYRRDEEFAPSKVEEPDVAA